MTQTHLISALAVLAALLAGSQQAFARNRMYNPALGQFMQRDLLVSPTEPLGDRNLSDAQFTVRDPPGTPIDPLFGRNTADRRVTLPGLPRAAPGAATVFRSSITYASDSALPLDPDSLIPDPEYRDGMNVYQYVRSNPIRYQDPKGTHIYLKTGNNTLNPLNNLIHQNVCVDACEEGRQSLKCFSFGATASYRFGWLGVTWLGWELTAAEWAWGHAQNGAIGGIEGVIYLAEDTGTVTDTKKTTADQDRKWLSWMLRVRGDTRDFYNVGYLNCRTYSQKEFADAPGNH